MKRLLCGTLMAAMVLVVPAVPADAACPPRSGTVAPFQAPDTTPGTVSFTGGGWGHGVGMSQWGAKYAAELGCTEVDILAGYYPGTTLGTRTLTDVRVGLLMGGSTVVSSSTIVNRGTEAVPWYYMAKEIHVQAPGESLVVTASSEPRLSLRPAAGQDPFWTQPDVGPATIAAVLSSADATSSNRRLEIAGKTTAGGTPIRYGLGQLKIESARVGAPGTFEHILAATMEQYLRGLHEMPTSWASAALRAQAIAGRSYAQAMVGPRNGCSCTIWDSVRDQVYTGTLQQDTAPTYARWEQAVAATQSRVLLYGGSVIPAFYSSSNGGVSMADGLGRPYLPAQNTARWDAAASGNPHQRWTFNYSEDYIAGKFGMEQLLDIDTVETSVGRVYEITFDGLDASGAPVSKTVRGRDLRTMLSPGLRSDFFDVTFTPVPDPLAFDQFVAIDVDGDGRDEYAFHDRELGRLRVYRSSTTSNLGPQLADIGLATSWTGLAAADLDGDGDDEWIFHDRPNGRVVVYEGTAAGGLGSRTGVQTIDPRWATIDGADLLSGGGDELVLHDPAAAILSVHRAGLDGVGSRVTTAGVAAGVTHVHLTDVDGDDRAEILLYEEDSGALRFHHLTGTGTLSTLLGRQVVASGWDGITAADAEGDGRDELVFSRPRSGQLVAYRMAVTAPPGARLSSYAVAAGWDIVAAGDFDGGGPELLFHRPATGVTAVYGTDDVGRLTGRLSATQLGRGWTTVLPLDLDGDGVDELLFHRASTGQVLTYDVTPTGTLASRLAAYTVTAGWSDLVAGDFDRDGTDELVFHRASTGQVATYDLDPAGRLAGRLDAYGVATGWTQLVTGDLDGDARDELGFHRATTGRMGAYETNPDGRIVRLLYAATLGTAWSSLPTGDVDGDGDVELLAHRRDTGTIDVREAAMGVALGSRLATYQLP